MLSCREVVKNADTLLARELPWRQRLAMSIHLLICHHCRNYVRQLKSLLLAIPFMHRKAGEQEVEKIMTAISVNSQQPPQ
jgi:hypothetical protein